MFVRRLFSLCLGISTLAVIGLAVPTAAAGPILTVSPSSGLKTGQVVTVAGSGFKPSDHVFVVECQANATGQNGCAIGTATPVKITRSGMLPRVKFRVHTGKIGNARCGTNALNAGRCVVSVGNVTKGDTASASITFKVR